MTTSPAPLRVVCFSPYPAEGPSVRHRIAGYAALWQAAGVELTLWSFMPSRFYAVRRKFGRLATLEKLFWFALSTARLWVRALQAGRFDVVIIHREAFPLGGLFFEKLIGARNAKVIYDFDDAIWQQPSNAVNQRARFWQPDRIAGILGLCRHAVAGNGFLQDYAKQSCPQTSVIPTTYPDARLEAPHDNAIPVIVWIGNLGNAFYVQDLLTVLEELATELRFKLRLIGGVDLEEIRSDKFEIERIQWSKDQEDRLLSQSDIGIMPLYDKPYEQGKCAFKLIQYYSVGLPVVASPVGMNKDVVRHGDNGFLASSPAEWREALRTLLTQREKRLSMGAAGKQMYLLRFTREAGARAWLQVFDKVSGRHFKDATA